MTERPSLTTVDMLLEAVRCITPRDDIRLSYYPGRNGQFTAYLLRSGEIARISVLRDHESDYPNTSLVTLGYSLEYFDYPDKVLNDIFSAVGPDVEPKTYEERLGRWQIARGFAPASLSADPDRFEIPTYLTVNPDYTDRFNEVLRSAPSLMDKVREVSNGSREGIGRFVEGGHALDSKKGLPELVSTALFVDGSDIYILRRPQVIPGNHHFILADYEWKKKLEIREVSEGPILYVDALHRFGYPLPYSNLPRDERDFTVVYDPENDGFPCLYGGDKYPPGYEQARKAAQQLGLNRRLVSPVFPYSAGVTRNEGLVFLGVGGRYPLGIHTAYITPSMGKV